MPNSNLQKHIRRTIESIPTSVPTAPAFLDQTNIFLLNIEALRRKLFLKVSVELSQNGLVMLQTVDRHLKMEINSLRRQMQRELTLTDQQKRCYGLINIKLELLQQDCVDALIKINNDSKRHETDERRVKIDTFIKTLYMKVMFKHLLSKEETETQLEENHNTIDELNQIEPFIKNKVNIECHDIITGSLRQRMMMAIKEISKENKRKIKSSFFGFNKSNYRNRVHKMNRFYSELHNIDTLTTQEFIEKADSVIQICNQHTSFWSYYFSRKPTRTANQLNQLKESTLNQTLLNRVRQDSQLLM